MGQTKKLVLQDFLFRGARFIHDSLKEMKERTARVKGSKSGESKKLNEHNTEIEKNSTITDSVEGDGNKGQGNESQEATLTQLEQQINETSILHDVNEYGVCGKKFDTRIVVCKHCQRRLLKGLLEIHMHEAHSGENTCLVEE